MKEKVIVQAIGTKGIATIKLPIIKDFAKTKSALKKDIGEFKIKITEIVDKSYTDLLGKNLSIDDLNKLLMMDKRRYTLAILNTLDLKMVDTLLKSKRYVFISDMNNENLSIVNRIKETPIYRKIEKVGENLGGYLLTEDEMRKYGHLLEENDIFIDEYIEYLSAYDISTDNNLIKEVENGEIRKCSECGQYTSVLNFSGEAEIEDTFYYDICDRCKGLLSVGLETEMIEVDYYDDFTEDGECCNY